MLRRLNDRLHRAAGVAAVLSLAGVFGVVLLQVTFRYVLGAPLVWTEEAARYLYVWVCYLGAAVAYRRGSHVAVALLPGSLPERAATALRLTTTGLGLPFLLVLGVQGARLTWAAHGTLAITFPLPWSAIYASTVVAAGLMLLQTLEVLADGLRRPRPRRP